MLKGLARDTGDLWPDTLIDEAETSLDASFHLELGSKDREDLREDARDRLNDWLATQSNLGEAS